MARYVDGFVMPLPKANIDRYREIASKAGELWKVSFRVVTYDWDAPASRAAAKGREDWAHCIRTGFAG